MHCSGVKAICAPAYCCCCLTRVSLSSGSVCRHTYSYHRQLEVLHSRLCVACRATESSTAPASQECLQHLSAISVVNSTRALARCTCHPGPGAGASLVQSAQAMAGTGCYQQAAAVNARPPCTLGDNQARRQCLNCRQQHHWQPAAHTSSTKVQSSTTAVSAVLQLPGQLVRQPTDLAQAAGQQQQQLESVR